MRKQLNLKKIAGVSGLVLLSLTLQGCWDDDSYTARRDSVTRAFGDANATNQATQTVDPWSPNAKNANVGTNGRRAATAAQRYEQGKVLQPRGLNTTTVIENTGPGNQADTTIQK
jgi:hypothetical protein